MDVFFADDSDHDAVRPGMGTVFGFGGLFVPEAQLKPLGEAVEAILAEFGVPSKTELKWSPKAGNFIKEKLGDTRTELYRRVIRSAREHEGRVIVVAWASGWTTLKTKSAVLNHTIKYLFQRITMNLEKRKQLGLIVADRPGGGKKTEDALLVNALEMVMGGAEYVKSKQLTMNLLTAPSHLNRFLQIADLITGATTCLVAGKKAYAEPVFEEIRPMFIKNFHDYAGGTGLVLFPNELRNLHFYVLGENTFVKVAQNGGWPLPWRAWPYYYDDWDPSPRTKERGDRQKGEKPSAE